MTPETLQKHHDLIVAPYRDIVQQLGRFSQALRAVGEWQTQRPIIEFIDSQLPIISKYTALEVHETREEASRGNLVETQQEATDVYFLILSIISNFKLPVNPSEVAKNVNGQGRRSKFFDEMSEIAGNLEQKKLLREVELLLSHLFSYLLHSEEPFDLLSMLNHYTLPKDRRNYPKEIFDGKDNDGNQIPPEEWSKAHEVFKGRLREIRKQVPQLGVDTTFGLPYAYSFPLISTIKDLSRPDEEVKPELIEKVKVLHLNNSDEWRKNHVLTVT
jgi:hypothetical protein